METCHNCDKPLGWGEEPGWPCDACTETQPMDTWVSKWDTNKEATSNGTL